MAFNPTAIPISAILDAPMTLLTITFDRPLVPQGVLDIGNWAVRWNNLNRNIGPTSAVGSTVLVNLSVGGADAGIDRVTYSPPPFDVLTLVGGNPVAAFSDFPVTM